MSAPSAAMSGIPLTLIDSKTTGNGIVAVPPSFQNHNILIKTAADVTSGAVQIETNNDYTDAGTWAQVGGGPITVVAATSVVANFSGYFNFLRARVSTTIAGGAAPSVIVQYTGAKSY